MGHMTVGVRELKNNLSRYVREVERGKIVAVTAHGRIVAELVPPQTRSTKAPLSKWDRLVAAGVIHPAIENGDPLEDDGVEIRLPAGTTQEWNDWDKEDDR
jgi:prevent-host-death family protein